MGWKAAQKLIRHRKILRGDNVTIIRGKEKGETGIVEPVIRSKNRVLVEGKNLVKRHIKQGQGHESGIFNGRSGPSSCIKRFKFLIRKPCKVGVRYFKDGTKVESIWRLGTSGSIIPHPENLKIRTTPRPTVAHLAVSILQIKVVDWRPYSWSQGYSNGSRAGKNL